jgi:hypothetical protein
MITPFRGCQPTSLSTLLSDPNQLLPLIYPPGTLRFNGCAKRFAGYFWGSKPNFQYGLPALVHILLTSHGDEVVAREGCWSGWMRPRGHFHAVARSARWHQGAVPWINVPQLVGTVSPSRGCPAGATGNRQPPMPLTRHAATRLCAACQRRTPPIPRPARRPRVRSPVGGAPVWA